jgi:hypothetical protein
MRTWANGIWERILPRHPLIIPVRRSPKHRDQGPQLALDLDDERRRSNAENKQIALARFRTRFPKPVAAPSSRSASFSGS